MGAERKSNARQLTEWDIPLHYLWSNAMGLSGWKFEGNGTIRLRADVGSYREKPGASPSFPVRGIFLTRDSSMPLTGSGSAAAGGCTVTLRGHGTFAAPASGGGASLPLVLASGAKVDTNSRQGAIGLALGAASAGDIPFIATISGGQNCYGTYTVAPLFGILEGADMFPVPPDDTAVLPLPALQVSYDRNFRLLQKKFTDGSFGGTITVEWQGSVAPISPPNNDAPR